MNPTRNPEPIVDCPPRAKRPGSASVKAVPEAVLAESNVTPPFKSKPFHCNVGELNEAFAEIRTVFAATA